MSPIRISRGDIAGRLIRFFRGKGNYPLQLDETAVPVVLVHDLTRESDLGEVVSQEGIRYSRTVQKTSAPALFTTGALLNPPGSSAIIEVVSAGAGEVPASGGGNFELQVGASQDVIDEGLTNLTDVTGVRTNLSGIEPDSLTAPFASVGRVFAGRSTTRPLGAQIEARHTTANTERIPYYFDAPPLILPPGWCAIISSFVAETELMFHWVWKEYSR